MIKVVQKGWGHEKIIHNSDGYCGKILFFKKSKKCSYHYHIKKNETFYCVGKVLIKFGEDDNYKNANEKILNTGETFHVPAGLRHQIIAIEDSEIFEFSSTHFEEDSIRTVLGDVL